MLEKTVTAEHCHFVLEPVHKPASVKCERGFENQGSQHCKKKRHDPVMIAPQQYVINEYSGKYRDHNPRYHKEEPQAHQGVYGTELPFQPLKYKCAQGFALIAPFKIFCRSKSQDYTCKAVINILYRKLAPAHSRIIDVARFSLSAFPDNEVVEIPVYYARYRQLKEAFKVFAVSVDLEAEFPAGAHDILHVAAITRNSCLYTKFFEREVLAEISQHHCKRSRSAFSGFHLIYCWGFDICFAH